MSSFVDKVGSLVGRKSTRDEYKPLEEEEEIEIEDKRTSFSVQDSTRYTDSENIVDPEANVGLLSGVDRDRDGDGDVLSREDGKPLWTKKEKSRVCFCCGYDWSLVLKILGVVSLLGFLFASYKILKWAFYEPPTTGLASSIPQFGTSLGCISSPFLYNNTKQTFHIPIHAERQDHGIDIRGGAIGTVFLTEEKQARSSNSVRYEITIRGNNQEYLQKTIFTPPKMGLDNMNPSVMVISTPSPPSKESELCIKYDIKMYIPKSLRKLHLGTHTLSHIKFDPKANIRMEDLFVTLYAMNTQNLLESSTSVKADRMALEVYRGWIKGDVSIVDETSILTQRGDGTVLIDVYPESPQDKDQAKPKVASLQTTTGAGRTNVRYHANKGKKRPIDSVHMSSRNGPLEFTYKDANFNGLLQLEAKTFTADGIKHLEFDGHDEEQMFTDSVGDAHGGDKMVVKTRGWVGLYF